MIGLTQQRQHVIKLGSFRPYERGWQAHLSVIRIGDTITAIEGGAQLRRRHMCGSPAEWIDGFMHTFESGYVYWLEAAAPCDVRVVVLRPITKGKESN